VGFVFCASCKILWHGKDEVMCLMGRWEFFYPRAFFSSKTVAQGVCGVGVCGGGGVRYS
jgi:hypothetical protein